MSISCLRLLRDPRHALLNVEVQHVEVLDVSEEPDYVALDPPAVDVNG
jgi:hypothetical protein